MKYEGTIRRALKLQNVALRHMSVLYNNTKKYLLHYASSFFYYFLPCSLQWFSSPRQHYNMSHERMNCLNLIHFRCADQYLSLNPEFDSFVFVCSIHKDLIKSCSTQKQTSLIKSIVETKKIIFTF